MALNALALSTAIGSVLTPAHAVSFGEITIETALGQPLSARVPVTLQAGESLAAGCISVPASGGGLGALPRPMISVPEAAAAGLYDLRITTTQALYEPMYELQVQVRCPGTPLLVRQYVLMLDLPGTASQAAMPSATSRAMPVATPDVPATAAVVAGAAPPAVTRPRRARPAVTTATPIEGGTAYRVVEGDTLSTIAARVSGRGGQGIWATADRIFAANPDAFIGGNPDMIKLGSEITIPSPGTDTAPTATQQTAPAEPEASAAVAATPAAAPAPAADANVMSPPVATAPAATGQLATDEAPAATTPPAVFQDEQPVAATVEAVEAAVEAEEQPAAKPEVVAVRADRETPAWLAALIGVLIGAVASIALLRERLLKGLMGLAPAARPAIAPVVTTEAAPAAAPTPKFSKPLVPREPSMVVVEEPAQEAVESEPATALPASDLSQLFGDERTQEMPEVDGQSGLAELDLDLSAATPDGPVDEDIGWIGDDTSLTPTDGMPRLDGSGGDTVEHIDLQSLASQATVDEQASQTLRDALNLLENDYEDELTASQVIDQKKLRDILEDDGEEDTLVRTGTDQIPRR